MTASESTPLRDRYLTLIEQIIANTLQGKIRSKHQVYRTLGENINLGTGEIFERCLDERSAQAKEALESQTDELKKAKATRQMRAIQTIQDAWQQWQKEKQQTNTISQAQTAILSAPERERFLVLLQVLDINQPQPLTPGQIEQLAKSLQPNESDSQIQQIIAGLTRGLQAINALEDSLVSWIYEQSSSVLGFEGVPGQQGPWNVWAGKVKSILPQKLLQSQALNQSASEVAIAYRNAELSAWIELTVILRWLQQGLVSWFDRQPYSSQWGRRLSSATLITFAVIWNELANGLQQGNDSQGLVRGSFQAVLQILRNFARRKDFPLYGGIFASFAGEGLRDTLKYLDDPLKEIEKTQEKGRILTLLGYSQRTLGRYDRAKDFHQEALEIARAAGDFRCEIANLNHLSRISIAEKDYEAAINHSQRALIVARQKGDRVGEANALTNLGYSEVLAARQREQMEAEVYEVSIEYLKQSLLLSERLGDVFDRDVVRYQTQALAYNSLGIAYTLVEQPTTAIEYLERGVEAARAIGDLYLTGLNYTYLAEAYYRLNNTELALYNGSLGMFFLERISARDWRQAAGLITIVQGQMEEVAFNSLLAQIRSQIVAVIGVDGFDSLPQLLESYRRS
jgi:tetratricopeptide (TPR) repeat protein